VKAEPSLRGRPAAMAVGRWLAGLLRGSWRPEPSAINLPTVNALAPRVLDCGLSGLIWRCLPIDDRRTRLGRELQSAARADAAAAARLDAHLPTVLQALTSAGVDAIVPKGWSVARYYPDSGLRPYSDIDVCVGPENGERAKRALSELGVVGELVDLHVGLPDLPQRTWAEVFARSKVIESSGVVVRVLAPEDQFRWLAAHLVRHVCHRPLWLVDLAVLLEHTGPDMDWDVCLRGSHTWRRWQLAVAGLAGRLLGARLPLAIADRPGTRPPDWLEAVTLWRWGGGDEIRGRELWKRPGAWWPYVAHKYLGPARSVYRLGLPPVSYTPAVWAAVVLARGFHPFPRIWRAIQKRRRRPAGLFPVHERRLF